MVINSKIYRCNAISNFLLWFLFLELTKKTTSQHPSINITQFKKLDENQTYRQNVCDRQRKFANDTLLLRDALDGLELNVAIVNDDNYFRSNETGGIDHSNPGAIFNILNEVATRANFTWQNSFALFRGPHDPDTRDPDNPDRNWTELVDWTTENFDITAGRLIHSLDRFELGVTFPVGWYDATVIMVTKNILQKDFDIFSWMNPFSLSVWGMILLTIIASSFFMIFLENKTTVTGIRKEIFRAALTFTTGDIHRHPRKPSSRVLALSLTLWVMLIGAAYTANLANFLIAESRSSVTISSIDDAVRERMKICIRINTATAEIVLRASPESEQFFIPKINESENIAGLNAGDCEIAIVTMTQWKSLERQSNVNKDCQNKWVGRAVDFSEGGFATRSDSGDKCSNLIRDTLNLHLAEMRRDRVTERIVDNHVNNNTDMEPCVHESKKSNREDTTQLNLSEMAGIFLLHVFGIGIAIFVEFKRQYQKYSKKCFQGGKSESDAENYSEEMYDEDNQEVFNSRLSEVISEFHTKMNEYQYEVKALLDTQLVTSRSILVEGKSE